MTQKSPPQETLLLLVHLIEACPSRYNTEQPTYKQDGGKFIYGLLGFVGFIYGEPRPYPPVDERSKTPQWLGRQKERLGLSADAMRVLLAQRLPAGEMADVLRKLAAHENVGSIQPSFVENAVKTALPS